MSENIENEETASFEELKRNNPALAEETRLVEYLYGIVNLGKKHGFSLSHEDNHGGFQVNKREDEDVNDRWLLDAELSRRHED